MGTHIAWIKADCLTVTGGSGIEIAQIEAGNAEIVMGDRVSRARRDGLTIAFSSGGKIAGCLKRVAKIVVRLCVARFERYRFPGRSNCVLWPAKLVQAVAEIAGDGRIFGIFCQRLSKRFGGLRVISFRGVNRAEKSLNGARIPLAEQLFQNL